MPLDPLVPNAAANSWPPTPPPATPASVFRNDDARVIVVRPERRACPVPADGKFCLEPRVVELVGKLSALRGARIDHQRARMVCDECRVHYSTAARDLVGRDQEPHSRSQSAMALEHAARCDVKPITLTAPVADPGQCRHVVLAQNPH